MSVRAGVLRMRIAVLADVHANLAALDAVLGEVARATPDAIVCLGDIVGYNAEPGPCVDAVRELVHFTVAGNHDLDVANAEDRADTHKSARAAQAWTRDNLDQERLSFLRGLPRNIQPHEAFVAVHACYLNDDHTFGYVTSSMLQQNLERVAEHPGWPRIALCGHSHQPLLGWLDDQGRVVEPRFVDVVEWPVSARAVLINPGAVGQPRDRDPRAAFALVDLDRRCARLHRVAYDVEHAVGVVLRAGLPEDTALRLREGR